jgi:hypothetical protein
VVQAGEDARFRIALPDISAPPDVERCVAEAQAYLCRLTGRAVPRCLVEGHDNAMLFRAGTESGYWSCPTSEWAWPLLEAESTKNRSAGPVARRPRAPELIGLQNLRRKAASTPRCASGVRHTNRLETRRCSERGLAGYVLPSSVIERLLECPFGCQPATCPAGRGGCSDLEHAKWRVRGSDSFVVVVLGHDWESVLDCCGGDQGVGEFDCALDPGCLAV